MKRFLSFLLAPTVLLIVGRRPAAGTDESLLAAEISPFSASADMPANSSVPMYEGTQKPTTTSVFAAYDSATVMIYLADSNFESQYSQGRKSLVFENNEHCEGGSNSMHTTATSACCSG